MLRLIFLPHCGWFAASLLSVWVVTSGPKVGGKEEEKEEEEEEVVEVEG